PQVVGAVGDVRLRIGEVGDGELRPARAPRDEPRRVRLDLHQPLGAGRGVAGVELGLRVDDRRDERWVEVLARGLLANDVVVAQRQGDLLHRVVKHRVQQEAAQAERGEGYDGGDGTATDDLRARHGPA